MYPPRNPNLHIHVNCTLHHHHHITTSLVIIILSRSFQKKNKIFPSYYSGMIAQYHFKPYISVSTQLSQNVFFLSLSLKIILHHYVTLSCYYHLWNFFLPPPPSLPLFFISCLSWCCAAGMVVVPYFTKIIPLFPFFAVFYNASVLHYSKTARHSHSSEYTPVKSSHPVLSSISTFTIYHILYTFPKKKLYSAAVCLPDWNTKVAAAWAAIVVFPTVMLLVFLFLHESRFECKMSCTISFTAAASQSHLLFCWLG